MLKEQAFLLFFSIITFQSCKVFERGVEIPAYIYVKPVKLIVNPDLQQGVASIDSNDIWLFANGSFLGAFASPATVPVLKFGDVEITCNHGIKQSGQDEERMIYPMFKEFRTRVNLQKLKIDTISPVVSYVENAVFPLIEDFDMPGLSFEFNTQLKQNGDTIIRQSGSQAWNANGFSGRVILNNDSSIFEIFSRVFNNFRRFTPTFLEMDYKNNIPFYMGIYISEPDGNVRQVPIFYFNPRANWNKIYINLENEIAAYQGNSAIRIFFRFSKIYDRQVAEPNIWLDNIKLVYLD
ncbi:MAG: hypothetical protein ACK4K9_04535 [Bacteroidia bacterium]